MQRRSEESPTRWLLVGTEGEFSRCRCIFKKGVGTIREAQEIVTGFYQEHIGDNPA